jgi:hypothetical protein
MKRYGYAMLIALVALLIPAAVGAEPTPPAGYSCQFYTPTCDEIGGGGLCRSYLTITEFPVGNLVYFSDQSYGYSTTPLFNSDGAGNGTAISQGEIYTITETIVPLDDYLPSGMFAIDTPYSVSGAGLYRCYEGDPTPTPSPSPTPVTGSQVEIDWHDAGCESAEISCASGDNPHVYANGLQIGRCISSPLTFNSRPQMTNTITLLADSEFTANVNVACQSTMGAMSPAEPMTGTVLGLSEPETFTATSGQVEVLGGGGFLGIDMGGDLGNPDAPINQWLDIATDFLDVVNSGNLLYIIGAIGGAGAVLAWAISTVRHPETF